MSVADWVRDLTKATSWLSGAGLLGPLSWAAKPVLDIAVATEDTATEMHRSDAGKDFKTALSSVENLVSLTPVGGVSRPLFDFMKGLTGVTVAPQGGGGDVRRPSRPSGGGGGGDVRRPSRPGGGTSGGGSGGYSRPSQPSPGPGGSSHGWSGGGGGGYSRPSRDADSRGNCYRPRPRLPGGGTSGGEFDWMANMLGGFFAPIAAELQGTLASIIPYLVLAFVAIIILKFAL